MFRFAIRDWVWLSAVVLLAVGLLFTLAELERRTIRDRLEIGRLKIALPAAESQLDGAEAILAGLGHPIPPRERY